MVVIAVTVAVAAVTVTVIDPVVLVTAMSSKDTEIDNTGASTIGKGTNKNYVPCVTFPSMIAAKAGIANREIGGQL